MKIILPKLGESIHSATIVQWFKKVGDPVALDEPLLEVATDKVNSEIPSPSAGILSEIFAQVDEEVAVGAPLALLSSGEAEKEEFKQAVEPAPGESAAIDRSGFLSPSVMRILREKGIALSEVDRIPRTGEGGRLSKKDVENFCSASVKLKEAPACSMQKAGIERVKMTPMRKAIADNMVKSFYEAPHASLITEVDVTNTLKRIAEHKQQTGEKLTITAFAAKALATALHTYPLLNSSLEGDTIVMKHFVHLGIAVSVDQGVMVPVLQHAERKSVEQIGKEIGQLAEKTRSHSLSPDDTKEGTITLTNFGMTGVMIGVPIIRHGEVAIVGMGAITKKVVVAPDDSMAIRSVMMLSLTFDHRVLDGIYGCAFLNELKQRIENPSEG